MRIVLLACVLGLAGCGEKAEAPVAVEPVPVTEQKTQGSPVLTVSVGGETKTFSAAELLARSDLASVETVNDAAYKSAMTYRAVPFRALLPAVKSGETDTLEMRATDGFVAQLPTKLLEGGATPWLAVEDPAQLWPNVPGKTMSPGPFYLVWEKPELSGVSPEQWPYALASVTAVASPAQRWPGLAAAANASAEVMRGQAVYATSCLACHKLGGLGEATMAPDLLKPMPATTYFTDAGLRALIRDPASVRDWPGQQMPAFDVKTISDDDVSAVIAYLKHLAAK